MYPGADPGFQELGGGRHANFWGISYEKSRFYVKKSYFFQFLQPPLCTGTLI